MCASKMLSSRCLARYLPTLMFCLLSVERSFAGDEDALTGPVLWDTHGTADGAPVDMDRKTGWERISPGKAVQRLSGDVVVENERIAVLFSRQSAGPLVCPKPVSSPGKNNSWLVPVAPDREPATRLSEIEIRKNDEDQVMIEVSARTRAGQEIRTAFTLARGQAFLECRPIQNAARIRVEAATRFAVIPDFFGADMVFDPRAYSQPNLIIPPENFVLGLIEGESTIVMCVWPTGDHEVTLGLKGVKEERRIAATEITFDGKSVYVAILHAPGIWHERPLREPYVDKDISLGWKKPFSAKWRANFCSQRQSDSWDFQDRKSETWMYLYQAIVWPCWFDGEGAFVRLSRRFIGVKGPMEFVLVYPSDRKKDTPLATFTPVDIVRETLGVGPCEYVLDREGLQGRSANTGRKNFGRGVCDTTTPIEYFFIKGMEAREADLVGHLVDDIQADISAINARVLEFRSCAKELREWAAATPRGAGPAAQLLDQVEKSAQEIESLYQEKLPIIQNPAHAAQLGQRIKALAVNTDPENLGECKTLTRELRDIAGTQHLMVGDYRVMVKRLRQAAAIQGSEDPSTAKLAEKIRKLGGQVLRRKYGVEAD